ncbi:PD-(D/E)XK nuclease family protein [Pseudomonas sp. P115]|uniref:PDDEXK-like family protein n=1 Tax=Pseudomonas pisciculturae TaxID=2730413 RepID=UPI0018926BCE|nr:PD-(D/E)XK nuclease family protein [Pseudomonas pisciculturae]MBF6028450.1 PD-(D/E)XK nuclease family protein [Pseudomonas pisciculturae]
MEAAARLETLRVSPGFNALGKYTAAFDMFKVMGVSTKELIHSNILAALFNANGSHGLDSLFRDAYVASLAKLPCSGEALPLALQVLQSVKGIKAKVAREVAHIDVLLEFPEKRVVIAIENKIWAADQRDQVARYQQALCELYPHHEYRALVYLTPTGRASPTQDLLSPVPVYHQSYGEVAALLRQYQFQATSSAAFFIDQFCTHVEKTMSGNSDLNDLCWDIFQQNEDAYAHLVKQYEYCKTRKMTELFDRLGERLASDRLFGDVADEMQLRPAFRTDKQQYDLDVRLTSWPEGVWIKIYKHNWFGVFPFFRGECREALSVRLPTFTQPAHAVPDWADLYFASTRFLVKEDRCVLEQGDKVTDIHLDQALTRVRDCMAEINLVLGRQ